MDGDPEHNSEQASYHPVVTHLHKGLESVFRGFWTLAHDLVVPAASYAGSYKFPERYQFRKEGKSYAPHTAWQEIIDTVMPWGELPPRVIQNEDDSINVVDYVIQNRDGPDIFVESKGLQNYEQRLYEGFENSLIQHTHSLIVQEYENRSTGKKLDERFNQAQMAAYSVGGQVSPMIPYISFRIREWLGIVKVVATSRPSMQEEFRKQVYSSLEHNARAYAQQQMNDVQLFINIPSIDTK